MTKTLKGCLQSEVQTHSLTEDSRLTTALQRQHGERGSRAVELPVRPSLPMKQTGRQRRGHRLQAVPCLLVLF